MEEFRGYQYGQLWIFKSNLLCQKKLEPFYWKEPNIENLSIPSSKLKKNLIMKIRKMRKTNVKIFLICYQIFWNGTLHLGRIVGSYCYTFHSGSTLLKVVYFQKMEKNLRLSYLLSKRAKNICINKCSLHQNDFEICWINLEFLGQCSPQTFGNHSEGYTGWKNHCC